jgi:hypothetical protein
MTMSQKTAFLSEIASGNRIPAGKLAYFQERTRNNLYNYVLTRFFEQERAKGLTKAELARRIGRSPEVITSLLGAPGNWTIATISDLLLGIAGEELQPASSSVLGHVPRSCYENPKKGCGPRLGAPKLSRYPHPSLRHDLSVAAHHRGFDFGRIEEQRRREPMWSRTFPSPCHARLAHCSGSCCCRAEMLVHVEPNRCELGPDFAQLRRRATGAARGSAGVLGDTSLPDKL